MEETIDFEALKTAIVDGEADDAIEIVESAVEENILPGVIIDNALVPGMKIVAEKYEANEYFVPDLAASADAMQECLNILLPIMENNASDPKGTVVISTVEECSQEIGKNIVSAMLSGAGFKVYDLGTCTPAAEFVAKVKEVNADILAMGNPMTHTEKYLKQTIELLEAEGLRSKVKVVVGGASTTQEIADNVGADAFGKDGKEAIEICERFMNELRA